ncbi:ricin B lectin domain-containing protein, partial [Mycena rosella]
VFNTGIQGCIAVAENADGEPLIVHNCNTENLANQGWNLTFWTGPVKNVGPQHITVFGDKCIDVMDGVNADGTKLQIWTCSEGNPNQQWISVTDDTLQWNGTDKCIDLTDGKITDGNVLQIYTCDDSNSNQKW